MGTKTKGLAEGHGLYILAGDGEVKMKTGKYLFN